MIRQNTIKEPVTIEGIGLQTGSKVRLTLKSAPADSGINFIRVDLANKPFLNIQSLSFDNVGFKRRRTTIGAGSVEVQTTEHLLSAVNALSIDNIVIEIDGPELPGLDGSALEYVKMLEQAKIVEQDAAVRLLAVEKPIWCSGKGSFLAAFPYDGLKISYFLAYPVPSIGSQFLSLDISQESFKREIAPARTFCTEREALLLKILGYGKGANNKNALVMGKTGPLGNNLRFPDEPVRHKILDVLGDLCLAGTRIKAHVIAVKSGHKLNMELVKKLKN